MSFLVITVVVLQFAIAVVIGELGQAGVADRYIPVIREPLGAPGSTAIFLFIFWHHCVIFLLWWAV